MKVPNLFNQSVISEAIFPNNKDGKNHLSRKISKGNVSEQDKKAIIEFVKKETEKFIQNI